MFCIALAFTLEKFQSLLFQGSASNNLKERFPVLRRHCCRIISGRQRKFGSRRWISKDAIEVVWLKCIHPLQNCSNLLN